MFICERSSNCNAETETWVKTCVKTWAIGTVTMTELTIRMFMYRYDGPVSPSNLYQNMRRTNYLNCNDLQYEKNM